MSFRDEEKRRYSRIKNQLFTSEACLPGRYNNIPRSFCLDEGCSKENLFSGFRGEAIAYFRQRNIGWHDGLVDSLGNSKGLPSNHLCCSQSACVNVLWPITEDAQLLAAVFRPFFPELDEPLPIEVDKSLPDGAKPYLAFEWVGNQEIDYINEGKPRQRGALATSADFVFRFRRYDGHIQLVLGEWKYTEYYPKEKPDTNETRRVRYKDAFERWKIKQPRLPDYEHFFVEPFYQLMRLTLLAQEMELRKAEMDADIVSVMVVAPKANRDYRERFTSPVFAQFGRTIGEAWSYIAPSDRFLCLTTESVLTVIEQNAPQSLFGWRDYLLSRYGWWREGLV